MTGKVVKCENGVCTLTIPSASPEDAGHYVCEAENINGTAKSETDVTITCRSKQLYSREEL